MHVLDQAVILAPVLSDVVQNGDVDGRNEINNTKGATAGKMTSISWKRERARVREVPVSPAANSHARSNLGKARSGLP